VADFVVRIGADHAGLVRMADATRPGRELTPLTLEAKVSVIYRNLP
jgi:hypothetical protein